MSIRFPPAELTQLLRQWRDGDAEAADQLWPVIYGELKELAHQMLKHRRRGHPLKTTTLVHELYPRLLGSEELTWNDRGHFFAIAARAMRFIMVDQLRRRQAAKRGGDGVFVPLEEAIEVPLDVDVDLLALDDALKDFERFDHRKCRIVELSYFAGMTYEEIARFMEISPATVKRDLKTAKMWLLRELRQGTGGDPEG